MNEHTCCGILEQLKSQYPGTFYRPITCDDKMQMRVLGWGVKLYKLTTAKKVTDKGQATLQLNFCPICGTQINAEYGKRATPADVKEEA